MNDITRFISEGRLDEALRLANESVKRNPGDAVARSLLFELLVADGAFERAERALALAAEFDPKSAPVAAQLGRMVKAALARQEIWARGVRPVFYSTDSRALRRFEALETFLAGNHDGASEQIHALDATLRPVFCVNDGEPGLLRDCDDLIADTIEVLTPNGECVWLSLDDVVAIEFQHGARVLDRVWRPIDVELSGGRQLGGFFPATYPAAHGADGGRFRLGLSTEWNEEKPCRGRGLKCYLAGDDILAVDAIKTIRKAE